MTRTTKSGARRRGLVNSGRRGSSGDRADSGGRVNDRGQAGGPLPGIDAGTARHSRGIRDDTSSPEPLVAHTEHVMGTAVSFWLRPGPAASEATARALLARAVASLHEADATFSLHKPESPASRLRRGEIDVSAAPPEMAEVLALCERARELTGGWFDPWGLPGGLDPTGLVKGWAAQRALGIIEAGSLAAGLINAGGDIATFGEPAPDRPWRLGIRHPSSAQSLLGVVTLAGTAALATSGSYERGEHILTPGSGRPATAIAAATVAGRELTFTDVLATALIASGGALLSRLARMPGFEALVVGAAGAVWATDGFGAVFEAAA
jgi:thiamine biosynthesis lipoprotein